MTSEKKRRIVFMGTPDFSVPALKALIDSRHDVVAVYSQPPRPSGRGHKITKSPIHLTAESHNIPVFTPRSLRNLDAQKEFSNHNADIAIVAAYGLILPQEILTAPTYGCLNIHASLLPKWRGAAPIQRAILAGDDISGITLMQMDIGLDTGDILSKDTVEITSKTTGQSLHDELSKMGGDMLLPLLDNLDNLNPEKQDDAKATYAAKLSKEEAKLNFTKSAQDLERQIRAFTPWPGSFFTWQDKIIKVLSASVGESTDNHPGAFLVTKNTFSIACHDNTLIIHTLQIQGKKPMDAQAFINGYQPQNGEGI